MTRSVLPLILCFAMCFPLHAETKTHATKDYVGTSKVKGPRVTLSWEAWVDATPYKVKAGLMKWAKADKLLENVIKFELKSTKSTSAIFWYERDLPFPMPNEKNTLIAKLTKVSEDEYRMRWKLLEGSSKHFEKKWTFKKSGTGTWVQQSVTIELPISPPATIFHSRASGGIERDVARFKKHIGTKTISAKPKVDQ